MSDDPGPVEDAVAAWFGHVSDAMNRQLAIAEGAFTGVTGGGYDVKRWLDDLMRASTMAVDDAGTSLMLLTALVRDLTGGASSEAST